MPNSMTGFGRAERSDGGLAVTVEARSVNNRYLNLRTRVPPRFLALEARIEAAVREVVARGTVDIHVRVKARSGSDRPLLDLDVARGWLESARRLAREAKLDDALSLNTLVLLPGVAQLQEDEAATEQDGEVVLGAARSALGALKAMRAAEGERLQRELLRLLEGAEKAVAAIEVRAARVPVALQKRLRERLAQLLGAARANLDEGALEREVALLAERADITEELIRLRSHFDGFRAALKKREAVGRTLDFMVQEMARESSTIAAKNQDAVIGRRVIELRAQIERLREQVQNLE